MRATLTLFFGLFYAALLIPGAQMLFGFAAEEKLHGVEATTQPPFPDFTLERLLSEEFQHELNIWWNRSIGFRGFFVRTDNQINFSLFRELSAEYASPLVLGTNNDVFEKLYIDHANGADIVSDKRLEKLAESVAELQRRLEARGIPFLLLISPSKASIYPESVPERFRDPNAPDAKATNYARILPFLAERGVHVVDGRKLFEEWKGREPYRLFPRSGTHWSQFAACRIAAIVLGNLRDRGVNLGPLECEPSEVKSQPEPFDRDLADLCNVWHPEKMFDALPYPLPSKQASSTTAPDPTRSKVLFIGGSFLWSVFHYLDLEQVYSRRDMFYYFSRRFRFPGGSEERIKRDELDWGADIFSNDAVIVEVNEATLHTLGYGFVSDALRHL